MQFSDGYTDLPPGKIANVVTNLEMCEQPAPREPLAAPGAFVEHANADLDWYRDLFCRIGAPYLWSSRLRMSDDALRATLHDPNVELYTLDIAGRSEAMLELDFREPGECELAFFGVSESLVGTTAARFLMNEAIARAWSRPIRRFWVHTCTHDHPKAVPFYLRSGFTPFKYQIEVLDDPRVIGVLPPNVAPAIPIIER